MIPERINPVTLSNVESGNEVTLKAIHGGSRFRAKLYSMGLIPGTKLFIESQENYRGITLRARNGNFALGQGMAEKITVE